MHTAPPDDTDPSVTAQHARFLAALDTPTAALLRHRSAPGVLAVLKAAFPHGTSTIPADTLLDLIEEHPTLLAPTPSTTGTTPQPTSPGSRTEPRRTPRQHAQHWVKQQWLGTRLHDDTELYTLTSHGQEALDIAGRLTSARPPVSEHRLSNLITTIERFHDITATPQERIAALEARISALQTERDRLLAQPTASETDLVHLEAGGEADESDQTPHHPHTPHGTATPTGPDIDSLVRGYQELQHHLIGLPAEFSRVAESLEELRLDIIEAFRTDPRTPGDILDEYLHRADNLMEQTAEGRAFSASLDLLRDREVLSDLRKQLTALVQAAKQHNITLPGLHEDLTALIPSIRQGIEDVLAVRSRLTATLRDWILSHNHAADTELDDALKRADAALARWYATTTTRTHTTIPLLPDRLDVAHLREKLFDPQAEQPAELYSDPGEPVALELADVLAQGGPALNELAPLLSQFWANDTETHKRTARSLDALFNNMPNHLRRPVEIFGLLHLLSNQRATGPNGTGEAAQETGSSPDVVESVPWQQDSSDTAIFDTVRADGTQRTYRGPRLEPAPPVHDNARKCTESGR